MLMFLSNTFQEVFKFTEGRKLPTGFRKLKKGKEGEGGEIGEEVDGQENVVESNVKGKKNTQEGYARADSLDIPKLKKYVRAVAKEAKLFRRARKEWKDAVSIQRMSIWKLWNTIASDIAEIVYFAQRFVHVIFSPTDRSNMYLQYCAIKCLCRYSKTISMRSWRRLGMKVGHLLRLRWWGRDVEKLLVDKYEWTPKRNQKIQVQIIFGNQKRDCGWSNATWYSDQVAHSVMKCIYSPREIRKSGQNKYKLDFPKFHCLSDGKTRQKWQKSPRQLFCDEQKHPEAHPKVNSDAWES